MSNAACLLGNLRPEKTAGTPVIFATFIHYMLFRLTLLSTFLVFKFKCLITPVLG